MAHYMYLSYNIPEEVQRYEGVDAIEAFLYRRLREFGCLPRDESVIRFVDRCFGKKEKKKQIQIMIRLTDAEAVKTASDRSEFKHPEPTKIKREERKALRKISKRKRSSSEDSTVHKKIKDSRCPICLEDMDTKRNITLECDCVFHYKCINKWLSCKKVCPTCGKSVNLN